MTKPFNRPTRLTVHLEGSRVGELCQPESGKLEFSYDEEWIAHGYLLSPMHMEWSTRPQEAPSDVFGSLHGAFNDSLPDGFGLLLMDRYFQGQLGIQRGQITHLDRLAYIGTRGMGALEYKPEYEEPPANSELDIHHLFAQTLLDLEDDTESVVDELRLAGGSPAGAKSKITLALSDDRKTATSSFSPLAQGFEHWLIKFRDSNEHIDMGAIEYAYAEMARAAGLEMPETCLIESKGKKLTERFFGIKRFDRSGDTKLHTMSVAGILYGSHREPCVDYTDLLRLTDKVTQSPSQVERLALQMIFNAAVKNRDDHVKNFSFIRRPDGWVLSPCYDLTYNPKGMLGQHMTSFADRGIPTRADINRVCADFPYLNPVALIDQVYQGVGRWKEIATNLGIAKVMIDWVYRDIEGMMKELMA